MMLKLIYFCSLFTLFNCVVINNDPNVIIIGAGVAGISAAAELERAHIRNIKILEAESRVGGRVYTIHDGNDDSNEFIEMGAQWIEFGSDDIRFSKTLNGMVDIYKSNSTLLDKLHIQFVSFLTRKAMAKNRKINGVDFKESSDSLKNLMRENLEAYLEEYDNADGLLPFYEENFNGILRFVEKFCNFMTRVGDWNIETGKSFAEHEYDSILITNVYENDGIDKFYEVFLKRDTYTNEILNFDVQLNSEITNIDYSNKQVHVTTKNGHSHVADVVIVTVPIGVLKANYQTMFTPELQQRKINAIKSLNVAYIEKVIIEFEKAWWTDESKNFIVMWTDEDFQTIENDKPWLQSLFGFFVIDHQPRSLHALFYGTHVKELENVDDEHLYQELLQILRKITKGYYTVTDPIKFRRTSWSTNPHFLGSNSHSAKPLRENENINSLIMKPLRNSDGDEKVFFAGEATSVKLRATVYGAKESGEYAAHEILRALGWTE